MSAVPAVRAWTLTACGALSLMLSGCVANDPRHNDKARFGLAEQHANRLLLAGGYDARTAVGTKSDYAAETFHHYNRRTGHFEELSDFLKRNDMRGPDRFVIAFDFDTGEMFLRSDLRSLENLDGFD